MEVNLKLLVGDVSDNGQVTIVDEDRLCYLVRSESHGAIGIRTISKALLNEFVQYFEEHPHSNANQARNALSGTSDIDRFEYGYASTLTVLAKMAIQYSKVRRTTSLAPVSKTDQPLQQIVYGAPGTGKSFTINKQTEGEDVIRTTFHPDSDYSTFVGCYKPTTKEIPMRDVTGKVINESGKPVTENRIVYEFVYQAFLQAYIEAWTKYVDNKEEIQKQFLVIEEINRGNCAQIFGDLFQLLDRNDKGFSEYPIKADADMKKQLKKQFAVIKREELREGLDKKKVTDVLEGDILILPPNLYIWATMNTSDQSLFPIDSAFKRRWDWQYVPIANAAKGWTINVNGKQYDWWDFLEKINALIGSTTNSEDKKLGYFFCKTQNGIIDADTFVGKVIFYLWNDVFKDFELEGPKFVDTDGSKLTFNKFYLVDTKGNTTINQVKADIFLTNLEVRVIENVDDDEAGFEDEDSLDNDEGYNFFDGKDRSRYSINNQGQYNKRKLALECVKLFAQDHPNLSAQEIADIWYKLNLKLSGFVETADDHRTRAIGINDIRYEKRFYQFALPNGEIVFVNNQFNVELINDFIEKVNAQDWGIHIEKIEENVEEATTDIQRTETHASSQRFYVAFPDGSVIEERTQFETYVKALQRIGLDKAEPIAAQKRYTRKQCALIDTVQRNEIINSNFSYVTVSGYHIVKGILVNTMVDVLNNISNVLNLSLNVVLTSK